MRKPSVLFLIQHPDLPSSRVRVLNLLPTLAAHGLEVEVQSYPSGLVNKARQFRHLRQWDAVVVQKKLPSPGESLLLRIASKRLLYDMDDAVYLHHESAGSRNHFSRWIKCNTIASMSHLIIAGNQTLADAVRRYNQNICIVPSAVPTSDMPQHDYTSRAKSCTIGWVGGAINLPHLALLRPVLNRLHQKHDITLHIISSESIDMGSVPTTFIPWSLETQAAHIARFDIGVMPLPPSAHAAGKCGYKALQYMAASVPPVVTDTLCNRQIIAHHTDGFVADTWETFEQYLETLITQPELRRKMGIAARQKVESNYSLEVVGQQLAQILQNL